MPALSVAANRPHRRVLRVLGVAQIRYERGGGALGTWPHKYEAARQRKWF